MLKNYVQKFRKQQGITQVELADLVSVSRQTISSIESFRYTPSLPLALQMARVFKVSIEELFYEEK